MDEQNTQTAHHKNSTARIAVIAVVVVLLIIVSVIVFQMMNPKNSTTMVNETPTSDQLNTEASAVRPEYKDGTYTQIGEYVSPGGPESVEVTLTLVDGIVTDSIVEIQATRPNSRVKQTDFQANYKPMVIGKSIDEVNLTKVSGSSLTPKGFNDALEKIKTEARS